MGVTIKQEDTYLQVMNYEADRTLFWLIGMVEVDRKFTQASEFNRKCLARWGLRPVYLEFDRLVTWYTKGWLSWVVARFWYNGAVPTGWKVLEKFYRFGLIDTAAGEQFRWGDFWRIKAH